MPTTLEQVPALGRNRSPSLGSAVRPDRPARSGATRSSPGSRLQGPDPGLSRKGVLHSLAWGLVLTGLTTLAPYRYCENGNGRGLPFAVYGPSCGATFAAVGRPADGRIGGVVDLAKLLGDVLLWGGLAGGARAFLARRG